MDVKIRIRELESDLEFKSGPGIFISFLHILREKIWLIFFSLEDNALTDSVHIFPNS